MARDRRGRERTRREEAKWVVKRESGGRHPPSRPLTNLGGICAASARAVCALEVPGRVLAAPCPTYGEADDTPALIILFSLSDAKKSLVTVQVGVG